MPNAATPDAEMSHTLPREIIEMLEANGGTLTVHVGHIGGESLRHDGVFAPLAAWARAERAPLTVIVEGGGRVTVTNESNPGEGYGTIRGWSDDPGDAFDASREVTVEGAGYDVAGTFERFVALATPHLRERARTESGKRTKGRGRR